MNKDSTTPISTAVLTDSGKVRKFNEDSFYVSSDGRLIIVCDGMGGHAAGGLASKIAVETVKDVVYNHLANDINKATADITENLQPPARALVAAVRLANRRLFQMASRYEKLRGMGTTVVVILFDKYLACMAHVGDSRIFRLSEGKILQLTVDHSWLNELIEDNEIDENEIPTFAQRNVITRALGTSPAIKVDIHCEKYKPEDIYVLCTDGLHSSIEDEEIKAWLETEGETLESVTKKLVDTANTRDGTDNITLAIARVNQSPQKSKEVGVSTTIHEEDEKIQSREDKIIQNRYGDPIINMGAPRKPRLPPRRRAGLVATGAAVAIISFLLGIALRPREDPNAARPLPLLSDSVALSTADSLKAGQWTANTTTYASSVMVPNTNQSPITASEVREDAVLAFVFFSSLADYTAARLEDRGLVLDRLQPFSEQDRKNLAGEFSIFVIDSSGNVVHRVTGIKLPGVAE